LITRCLVSLGLVLASALVRWLSFDIFVFILSATHILSSPDDKALVVVTVKNL